MNRPSVITAAVLLSIATGAHAQWLNVPAPGIPKTKDGKLDFSAPTPRKPVAYPLKIVQQDDLVVILYEWFGEVRQIFLDGRTLSNDPNPAWLGYSVGHWDGDTLVVDTTGFNGKAWLDGAGHPGTEALRLTERYHRRDAGHMQVQLVIDDPKAYTKLWSVTLQLELLTGAELLEYVCDENEHDLQHVK